jgi:hypothetical protein
MEHTKQDASFGNAAESTGKLMKYSIRQQAINSSGVKKLNESKELLTLQKLLNDPSFYI